LRNDEGFSPLHLACIADRPDCVKALITAGADINAAGSVNQSSPLCFGKRDDHKAADACATEILNSHPNQLHLKVFKE